MALKSNLALILFFLCLSNSYANKSRLPTLATKQAANNIRFISNNGLFTYYQTRSGSLFLGTNYKVTEVLKSTEGTNYSLSATRHKKKMVATQDPYFHSYLGMRHLKKIFTLDYGTIIHQEIGDGIAPKLHHNDTWISYYNPYLKSIEFINLNMTALSFKLQIGSGKNPYFIPQIIMVDENTILYTDLNSAGVPGIVRFTINDKKSVPLYKTSSADIKIELCESDQYFFVSEFGIESSKRGSQISIFQKKTYDFTKVENVYTSGVNDIGNVICDATEGFIYFTKDTSPLDEGKKVYEIARTSLATKETKVMSDLQSVTSMINMDGNLLIPFRGQYYVLLGENNMANIDQLKVNTQVTEEGIEVSK